MALKVNDSLLKTYGMYWTNAGTIWSEKPYPMPQGYVYPTFGKWAIFLYFDPRPEKDRYYISKSYAKQALVDLVIAHARKKLT